MVVFCLRAYALRNRTGGIMPLTALKLFKNLSDETRLGIVLLLRELGELCVCDFCTAL
ncbi:arsenic resistance operon repressor, partial [Klebsiella pneumoniae]